MVKEHIHFFVVVVILLAAVALIDLGNSQLSGKSVDRRNVVMADATALDVQQATDDPAIISPQQQPPVLDPTSIAPQPRHDPPRCIQDLTNVLVSQFPNDNLAMIRNLDDQHGRYMTLWLYDKITFKEREVIYDIGPDSKVGSADDKWYNSPTQSVLVEREVATGPGGIDKLFWVRYPQLSLDPEIVSCTLPACTDIKIEISSTIFKDYNIRRLSPSLSGNRLALALEDTRTRPSIISTASCSFNPSAPDYCGNGIVAYTLLHTGTLGERSLSNGGLFYLDKNGNAFFYTTDVGTSGKVWPLPPETKTTGETPVSWLKGAPLMVLFMKRLSNQQAELNVLDLPGGTIIPLDQFSPLPHYVLLAYTFKSTVFTLYSTYDGSILRYFMKEIKKQEKLVGEWSKPYDAFYAKLLKTGEILVFITTPPASLWMLSCTPS